MNYQVVDKKLIWHPFTHLKFEKKNIVVTKAKGIYLYTDDGKKIIDAVGSWWTNVHGHSHPYIARKIAQQLRTMEHCIFSDFTHPPAVELAHLLSKIVPIKTSKIFYSDNGSTSVEVALKMALQYFYNIGKSHKNKIIAFKGAYHGDTFGGMSVAERNVFNKPFNSNLFKSYFIDIPNSKNFEKVKKSLLHLIRKEHIAAFIFEPLVQGVAGMRIYNKEYLDELIKICREHEIICIADEVFTGFGKTGKMFASDYLKNKPDIICLSKGLTGGFLPLGVTIANTSIYKAFVDNDKTKTFYHGHSYTANPLMCTAAIANIQLCLQKNFLQRIKTIHQQHLEFTKKIEKHLCVKNVRTLGLILAIEIKTYEKTHYLNKIATEIKKHFIEKNILIRPLGNVLYLVPPACITKKQLEYVYEEIEMFLEKQTRFR